MVKSKNDRKKLTQIEDGTYFVVDDSGSFFVIYLDQVLNSTVQYVWKDSLNKEETEIEESKNEEDWLIQ